jgi:hypothetical protein
MEVAHGEMVEKELNTLIERRSRKGEVDPDEREEAWKASVRRYNDTPLAQSAGDELYVLGQDGGDGGLAQLSELSLLLRSTSSLLCFSYKTKYTNSNFSTVS